MIYNVLGTLDVQPSIATILISSPFYGGHVSFYDWIYFSMGNLSAVRGGGSTCGSRECLMEFSNTVFVHLPSRSNEFRVHTNARISRRFLSNTVCSWAWKLERDSFFVLLSSWSKESTRIQNWKIGEEFLWNYRFIWHVHLIQYVCILGMNLLMVRLNTTMF